MGSQETYAVQIARAKSKLQRAQAALETMSQRRADTINWATVGDVEEINRYLDEWLRWAEGAASRVTQMGL